MKNTSKQILIVCGIAAGLTLAWGGRAAMRAHRDLVTLNVRDMDVQRVVKQMEWQTWEDIVVHKDVKGKVTLSVTKMPLVDVLRIVAEQTSSQSGKLYPLYTSRKSLATLEKGLRGEVDPATHGWTNLQVRGPFRAGGMAPRGGGPADSSAAGAESKVSLQISGKAVSFAARAFTRFAQAWVVPEDGMERMIHLNVNQASIPDAVARLARTACCKWSMIYTLRPGGGPGRPSGTPPMQIARNDLNGAAQESRPGPQAINESQREEMRKQRAAAEEELKEALPTAEREKVELAQKEREQQLQEMQNLTPEQRRERGAQMGGPNMSQRNLERIRNTTPEQRRQMAMMRPRGEPPTGARSK